MIREKIAVIFTNHSGDFVADLLNTPGKRVERLRKDKGWRQADLAQAVNVRQNYISSIEKDQAAPSAEIMAAIAKHLDTTLDFLMCLTDNPEQASDNEPTFIHPEAEQAARMIDDLPDAGRESVLRSVSGIHAHFMERKALEEEIGNLLKLIEDAQGVEYRRALERRLSHRFGGSESSSHVAPNSDSGLIA